MSEVGSLPAFAEAMEKARSEAYDWADQNGLSRASSQVAMRAFDNQQRAYRALSLALEIYAERNRQSERSTPNKRNTDQ